MRKSFGALLVLAALACACRDNQASTPASAASAPTATDAAAAVGERAGVANPALMRGVEEMVAESRDIGAIDRLDLEAHTVHVKLQAWQTWEVDDRKTFTTMLALYCDQHSATRGRYVDVIDNRSGKTLARYRPSGVELF